MESAWDVVADIVLYSTIQGGRETPIPLQKFNCMMQIDDQIFDVRLDLEDHGPLSPGERARISLRFLYPDRAKDYCNVGTKFLLREVNVIGEGVVKQSQL